MHILLDTHILIWLISTPEKIPAKLLKKLSQKNLNLYYSIVSLWEITIKLNIGKINLNLKEFVSELKIAEINVLPIIDTDIFILENLPLLHKDPFDRVLVAQAINNNFKLITHDQALPQYSKLIQLI